MAEIHVYNFMCFHSIVYHRKIVLYVEILLFYCGILYYIVPSQKNSAHAVQRFLHCIVVKHWTVGCWYSSILLWYLPLYCSSAKNPAHAVPAFLHCNGNSTTVVEVVGCWDSLILCGTIQPQSCCSQLVDCVGALDSRTLYLLYSSVVSWTILFSNNCPSFRSPLPLPPCSSSFSSFPLRHLETSLIKHGGDWLSLGACAVLPIPPWKWFIVFTYFRNWGSQGGGWWNMVKVRGLTVEIFLNGVSFLMLS